MNRHVLTLATALAATLTAQAALAISSGDLARDIRSAVAGRGIVNFSVTDGVVTLAGNVDSGSTAYAVRRAALRHDGIDRVIDLIDHD